MPRIIGASKITAKYQISIPESVREHLPVKIGDTIAFVLEKGRIFLTTEV